MHFSKFTALLPLVLLPAALAAPTTVDAAPTLLFGGPHTTDYNQTTDQVPYDADNMQILIKCNRGGDINTEDIQNLADDLQRRGETQYVARLKSVSSTLGSARVCIYNKYIFEDTHVSTWEMGWAVRGVKEKCCFTPFCAGGFQQGHGENGLAVDIVLKSAGNGC